MTGKKSKIVYSVLALLCFGVLMLPGYPGQKEEADLYGAVQYDMVVLGDSVFGERRDETSLPARIGEKLGISVFNGGLGGTCMGRLDEESSLGYTKDCLSMVSLAKSIAAGDFGTQQATRIRESATEYFPSTIDELAQVDFSQVEILLIGHGVNDYHGGEPIYAENDLYDEYTFTGALRSSIKTLQEAYPDMRIVLVTSPYAWYIAKGYTCEEYVLNGQVLEDFVDAEIAVAEELDIEIIDLYHDVFPHEKWEDWEMYTRDGLHPNDAGCELLAEKIAEYFAEHPQKE